MSNTTIQKPVPEVTLGVSVAIETITAELAVQYLQSCNHGNRHINKPVVEKYAHVMRTGGWHVNGEAVKFSKTARLLDGQHRLLACVASGVPLQVLVVRGLPETVMPTLDDGLKRSGSNVLGMAGYKNAANLSAMSDLVYRYDHDLAFSTALANQTRLEVLKHYPGLEECGVIATRCAQAFKRFPGSLFAGLYFLFADANQEKAAEFAKKFIDGTDLKDGDPILALRKLAMSYAMQRGYWSGHHWQCYIIKAWNAWYTGKSMKKLRIGEQENLYVDIVGRPRKPWHFVPGATNA